MDSTRSHPPPFNKQPIDRKEKWRADFPVDEAQDHYVARRDFTKFLILISGGFTLGQFWIAISSLFKIRRDIPNGVRIAGKSDLPIGGSLVFHFPTEKDGCVLVRLSSSEFVAFSNRCTHLMCPVIPKVAQGSFHCPCHNGFFDIRTGRPTGGPPERPLPRVRLEVHNEGIFAMGVETKAI